MTRNVKNTDCCSHHRRKSEQCKMSHQMSVEENSTYLRVVEIISKQIQQVKVKITNIYRCSVSSCNFFEFSAKLHLC